MLQGDDDVTASDADDPPSRKVARSSVAAAKHKGDGSADDSAQDADDSTCVKALPTMESSHSTCPSSCCITPNIGINVTQTPHSASESS